MKTEKTNKNTLNTLVSVFAILALVFLLLHYAVLPVTADINRLTATAGEYEKENRRLELRRDRIDEIETELGNLRRQYEESEMKMASTELLDEVFHDLEKILSQSGTNIISMSSGRVQSLEDENYAVINIDISASGTDEELMYLLCRLENFPYLLSIDSASLHSPDPRLHISLTLYFVNNRNEGTGSLSL